MKFDFKDEMLINCVLNEVVKANLSDPNSSDRPTADAVNAQILRNQQYLMIAVLRLMGTDTTNLEHDLEHKIKFDAERQAWCWFGNSQE